MEEANNEHNSKEEKNKVKKAIKRRNFIVPVVAIIVLFSIYVFFRGTYLETLDLGEKYIGVFWENVKYASITVIGNFFVVFGIVFFTTRRIHNTLKDFFKDENKEMPKLPNKSIAFIAAIIVSISTSSLIMNKLVLCFNATQFGENADPIFGYDIGYFVFQNPFIELVILYFLIASVAMVIYSAVYYIITFNFCFDGIDRQTLKKSSIVKQLTNRIMLIAVLISALVFVKTHDFGTQKFLTIKDAGLMYYLYGAGFTDVYIKLWGYRILSLVIIISVFLAIKAFYKGKTKNIVISISAVPAYMILLIIIIAGYNLIFVNSNELDKEKKYIQYNIGNTKNAYGIDIDEINIENSGTITQDAISNNSEVLNNVSIVNKDIVLKDVKVSQTGKGYYNYRNTQISKYNIKGKDEIVYVSPREIISSNGTYNNKTYEYTHGYGVIVTSASSTDANGNLNHIQKGFENNSNEINIKEPRIYYGLETNDTVVTNNNSKKEFDYPSLNTNNTENIENTYNGTAGLQLNFFDRLVLALKKGDLKLAFGSNVTSKSKILINRNIIKRAEKIMPYLTYDESPYLVVTDEGKLIWVLDAYTTTNNYPYSQKTILSQNGVSKTEINYIRNSVKVLIDSYDGTIKFYITDRTDPIVMAYRNIYPDLFEDIDEKIPEDISKHFVYPEFLYNIQANILERYHNIQPEVLYRKDDIWDVATHNTGKVLTKTGTEIKPYYTMVKLLNEEKPKLGLVLPYTPYDKPNIISYLIGSCDENGGQNLILYKFPSDSNVLGPMQLDTQIEQDETISKEINSLNVSGTKITKNMIIVPIDDTLLYVEPIYQQYINEDNSVPILKKIVVASGNKLAIGNNLKEALENLVSTYAVDIEVESTDTVKGLVLTIIKANKNLKQSSDNNDWEMIGKDVKKLQELIDKLEVVQEQELKKKKELEKELEKEQRNKQEADNTMVNQDEISENKK